MKKHVSKNSYYTGQEFRDCYTGANELSCDTIISYAA